MAQFTTIERDFEAICSGPWLCSKSDKTRQKHDSVESIFEEDAIGLLQDYFLCFNLLSYLCHNLWVRIQIFNRLLKDLNRE
jgi:hypothetical protein